jgi:hypothetical protein
VDRNHRSTAGQSHRITWAHAEEVNRELVNFIEEGIGKRYIEPIAEAEPEAVA